LPCSTHRPALDHPSSFTLGGTGGGVAYNKAEFEAIVRRRSTSPTTEVLIEESLLGWKEYEMVVRDERQLDHHLLDRKYRPDGRAYGRLDHGRARGR
jgi:hypothetical protein